METGKSLFVWFSRHITEYNLERRGMGGGGVRHGEGGIVLGYFKHIIEHILEHGGGGVSGSKKNGQEEVNCVCLGGGGGREPKREEERRRESGWR